MYSEKDSHWESIFDRLHELKGYQLENICITISNHNHLLLIATSSYSITSNWIWISYMYM